MIKKILCVLFLCQGLLLLGKDTKENSNPAILFPPNIGPNLVPEEKPDFKPIIPLIPLIPALPTKVENVDVDGNVRHLEKNFTVMMEAKVNIFIPLEIISDISIEANLFGDEVVHIPFEIELNREPEKKDFYKIFYSENKLDIDNDGKIDTYIYSPEFANSKIISENYVEVQGGNISKAGSYQKKVYVTVEAGI